MHVTFIKIGEINTLKETFDADVLIQAKWREPELDKSKIQVQKNNIPVNWTLLFESF